MSLIATAAPIAAVPAPAPPPDSDLIVGVSVAVRKTEVWPVIVAPPVASASTVLVIEFFVNEPPIAKVPAPAPPIAIVWIVALDSAFSSTRSVAEATCVPAPSALARTTLSIVLTATAAPPAAVPPPAPPPEIAVIVESSCART